MKVIFINKFFFVVIIILLVFLLAMFNISSISSYSEISNIQMVNKEDLSERELDIQNAFKEKKLIAITFDDGPGRFTENLLEELEKRKVSATFFILGINAKEHESLLKKISENNEIAIHGYSHKLFTKLNNDEIINEIKEVQNIILESTGISAKLIRPPYGTINNRVRDLFKEYEFTSVNWTVDSKDWHFRNSDKTYNHVLKTFHGNDIILMHDIYKTSVDAALKLIDHYMKEGYMFVTVSELLKAKEICIISEVEL